MNLKESYRYANYLDRLIDEAYSYLQNPGFTSSTTQRHLRSKVNDGAEDETVELQKPYDVDFNTNDVIDFVVKLIAEKESLANAIATAKAGIDVDIDNAVAMNKQKQRFVSVLNRLASMKTNSSTISGSGYKFNQEGNQVKYYYDIEQSTTINFDRNDVKSLIKKYSKACDEVSSKLDSVEITTEVQFVPRFDINDSFEDVIGL